MSDPSKAAETNPTEVENEEMCIAIENHLSIYGVHKACDCRFHRALRFAASDAHININEPAAEPAQGEQASPPTRAYCGFCKVELINTTAGLYGCPICKGTVIPLQPRLADREEYLREIRRQGPALEFCTCTLHRTDSANPMVAYELHKVANPNCPLPLSPRWKPASARPTGSMNHA
jgi:hypothetical protein